MTGLRYGLLIFSVLVALEHDVSTFISMGDDPVAMQRFAEEVAPELRSPVVCVRGWCHRGTHGDHTLAT